MEIQEIPIDKIKIPLDRKVDRDEEIIRALRRSIGQRGLSNPIELEKTKDGYSVISGHGRLYAFKRNRLQVEGRIDGTDFVDLEKDSYQAWTHIPARVVDIKDQEERLRRMLEENMLREELNPTELSDTLFQLKEIYEKDHPEAAQGKAKKPKKGKKKADGPSTPSFADYYAEALGRSTQSINDEVSFICCGAGFHFLCAHERGKGEKHSLR